MRRDGEGRWRNVKDRGRKRGGEGEMCKIERKREVEGKRNVREEGEN